MDQNPYQPPESEPTQRERGSVDWDQRLGWAAIVWLGAGFCFWKAWASFQWSMNPNVWSPETVARFQIVGAVLACGGFVLAGLGIGVIL